MLDPPSSLKSAVLLLYPVRWSQTLYTNQMFTMRFEAEASKRSGARLNVPGMGNILELPFDLALVRGPVNWKVGSLPPSSVGYLACDERHQDEFQMHRAVVRGEISLPEPVFDDVWDRVRSGPDFESIISLGIGPVSVFEPGQMVWDRAKDKVLFAMEVSLTFTRASKIDSLRQ
jgi:hypothetical protein